METKLANFLFQNDHGQDRNLADYRPEIQKMYHKEAEEILSLLAPVFEKAGKYEKAAKGLKAVEDLMNNSEGVMGLHLNGDIAPWSELRTEGRFEEWLLDFDEALSEVPDGK